jgi:hypothetical protein
VRGFTFKYWAASFAVSHSVSMSACFLVPATQEAGGCVDGYVVFLSSLRIKLLRILVASTSDLVEQVIGAVLTPSLLPTTRSLSPRIALSYKGTSGFIAKCLPDCEPDAEGCALALRTSIADAPSTFLFSFFM